MIRQIKNWYHLLVAIASCIWFRFPSRKLVVIGVTGTDGKTTTSTIIYEILKASGKKVSKITSVHAVIAGKEYDTGFHVTSPDPFYIQKYLREAVDHGDTHFVLEVTSHALSQHRVFGVQFAAAVITNVTHEHLDWHKNLDEYRNTKISLLKQARYAIVNRDDPELYDACVRQLFNRKIITFGIRREAQVTPETYPFTTSLPGEFNRYNCLAAIAVTQILGINQTTIQKALKEFSGIPGRMEVVQKSPFWVIVDFAHTPNAIEMALKTARTFTKKKIIHVFGSAGLRDRSKRPLMGEVSSRYADYIILTEEDYRTEDPEEIMTEIEHGITPGKSVSRIVRRNDAISFAIQMAKKGDIVIITGKGHEKSICRGSVEYPWTDQSAVKRALKKRL